MRRSIRILLTALRRATAMLTDARATPPTVMRWQTLGAVRDVTLTSLLSRGADPVKLPINSNEKRVTVTAIGADWREEVTLDGTLQPIDAEREEEEEGDQP